MIIGIIFAVITLLVLLTGIFLMARGGKLNQKYSGKLMTARVIFQLISVLVIFSFFLVRNSYHSSNPSVVEEEEVISVSNNS